PDEGFIYRFNHLIVVQQPAVFLRFDDGNVVSVVRPASNVYNHSVELVQPIWVFGVIRRVEQP
ncbi:hypothetical protein H072_7220, partial [Dactylellina haptotyla CBS 200.50]